MDPWPSSIFGFPVTKTPIGSFGAIQKPVSLGLHTNEGDTDEQTVAVFHADPGIASHFALDEDSIFQAVSLADHSGAVRGDTTVDPFLIQIEFTGRSKTKPWSLSKAQADRAAAVMAYAAAYHGIPLVIPNPKWKDDGSDIVGIWATEGNSRRAWSETHFPKTRGVYRHLDLPWNVHWDTGALNVRYLIDQANAYLKGETDVSEKDVRDAFGLSEAAATGAGDVLSGLWDFARGRDVAKDPIANDVRRKTYELAEKLDALK
jgi:hypothetical protein